MSRQDATDLLMAEREGGVFLVRDSTTIMGDYVLCVRCALYTCFYFERVKMINGFFFIFFYSQGGQQSESLHHKQDSTGRPNALSYWRSNVPRPACLIVVLQVALPGHDASDKAST